MIKRTVLITLLLCLMFPALGQNFTEPAISSDGKMLVFSVRSERGKALYTASADGSNIKLLVDLPQSESAPGWSPDGQSVVFYAIGDDDQRDIYTIGKDGDNLKNLTKGKLSGVQSPKWTNQGRIVFSYGKFPSINVYSMSDSGSEITALTAREGLNYYADMNKGALVYGHASRAGRGIFYKASASAETTQLSASGEAPVLSPDGTQVAFQDGHRTGAHIYIIDLKNDQKRQATEQLSSELPEWAPDGRSLYYQKKTEGVYEIWKLNIESGKSIPVVNKRLFEANK